MILIVLAVHDVKAAAFARPFYAQRMEVAIRDVQAAVMDSEGIMGKFPADYSLYRLGTFDDATGLFDLLPQPELVLTAVQLKGRS